MVDSISQRQFFQRRVISSKLDSGRELLPAAPCSGLLPMFGDRNQFLFGQILVLFIGGGVALALLPIYLGI